MLGAMTFGSPLPKVYVDCPLLVWLNESLGAVWPRALLKTLGLGKRETEAQGHCVS